MINFKNEKVYVISNNHFYKLSPDSRRPRAPPLPRWGTYYNGAAGISFAFSTSLHVQICPVTAPGGVTGSPCAETEHLLSLKSVLYSEH